MNRVFGKKKAPGPPPPSLDDASSGLGGRMETMDGKIAAVSKSSKGLFWYYMRATTFAHSSSSASKVWKRIENLQRQN